MQPAKSPPRRALSRNILNPPQGRRASGSRSLPARRPGEVCVLMSFYPYQKDGRMGSSHPYASRHFAERGYASLLVDLRRAGSSGGLSEGNLQQESLEGPEAVEWAAAQEWCSGEVALWGISYLAFAIAALRPPHLKPIVPVHGSWGRREDGGANGCRRCIGTAAWMSMMLALDLAPPFTRIPRAAGCKDEVSQSKALR
ncbi:putative CocE/NonD family hydrolase [Bradyrhizobium sp. RT5a]